MKLPGRKRVEAVEPESSEKLRLCPECGTPVSSRATTCAACGHDFVAAIQARQIVQAEQREEAAQRPVRAIVVGVTAGIVVLLTATLYFRNRAEAVAALTPTVTPTPTRTPTSTLTPTPSPTLPFTPTPLPPREYTVQPGDTIFYIAAVFETDYRAILTYNGLSENSILQVNQKILIPAPTVTPTPSSTPPTAAPSISPVPKELIHVVQAGETLITIAETYGVSTSVILSANDIQDPDLIRVGDRLIIPVAATPTPAPNAGAPTALPNYGPVTLLQPLDGGYLVGNDKAVLLHWLSAGILRNEETYRVTVEQVDGSLRHGPIYIRATALHLPSDLFPAPGDPHRTFRWTINIVRQVGVGNDGTPLYDVVSPSASRTFQWIPAPPTPTLTPVP